MTHDLESVTMAIAAIRRDGHGARLYMKPDCSFSPDFVQHKPGSSVWCFAAELLADWAEHVVEKPPEPPKRDLAEWYKRRSMRIAKARSGNRCHDTQKE